jgi:hypothetical protein
MAVIVEAETGGRRLTWTYRNRQLVRRYERTYRVYTNNMLTASLEAAFASGLPQWGDTYEAANESDEGAYVSEIGIEDSEENPFEWKAHITYESDVEQELVSDKEGKNQGNADNGGMAVGNPLARLPIISFATRQRQQPLESDYSLVPAPGNGNALAAIAANLKGRAVVNSAGERFDPPVMDDLHNLVVTITKNTIAYDPIMAWQYTGAVNSDPWLGNVPGLCKLNVWTGDQQEDNGIVYFANKWEIELQIGGWDWQVLNQGNYCIARDGTHDRIKPVDPNGMALNGLVMLDAKGHMLPQTSVASAAFGPGQAILVSVFSDANMDVGDMLRIDTGDAQEDVKIDALGPSSFTANFRNAHPNGCIVTGVPTYQTFQRKRAKFSKLRIPF